MMSTIANRITPLLVIAGFMATSLLTLHLFTEIYTLAVFEHSMRLHQHSIFDEVPFSFTPNWLDIALLLAAAIAAAAGLTTVLMRDKGWYKALAVSWAILLMIFAALDMLATRATRAPVPKWADKDEYAFADQLKVAVANRGDQNFIELNLKPVEVLAIHNDLVLLGKPWPRPKIGLPRVIHDGAHLPKVENLRLRLIPNGFAEFANAKRTEIAKKVTQEHSQWRTNHSWDPGKLNAHERSQHADAQLIHAYLSWQYPDHVLWLMDMQGLQPQSPAANTLRLQATNRAGWQDSRLVDGDMGKHGLQVETPWAQTQIANTYSPQGLLVDVAKSVDGQPSISQRIQLYGLTMDMLSYLPSEYYLPAIAPELEAFKLPEIER